jgi:ABC-2 type transport system permease protein
MTGLTALLRKELKEQYRTRRFLIVGAVFAMIGIGIPLMLKLLPEIMKLSGETIPVQIPPPTAVQTFVEFASTIGQLGVIVAVMVAMGAVANELRHGTAVTTLSKPISRAAFVTAKLVAISFTFLVALSIAASLCFFYTTGFIGGASATAFFQSNLLIGLLLVFCLAVTVLFSCLFKSSVAAGGLAITVIISQTMLSGLPFVGDYLPGKLLAWGASILSGPTQGYWGALGVTVALTFVAVYLGQYALRTKEI